MGIEAGIIGGGMLASAGLSYFGAKKAGKANREERRRASYEFDQSMLFEREKWGEYLTDLTSRREAIINERTQRDLLADRKFSAAMQDWTLKSGAIDEMIGMWKTFEEDPTKVPAWRAFNTAITGEAKKAIKGLGGQMERAGRTGGAQDTMRQDVSEKLMSKLGNEMLNIQEQARGKQLELEGSRPAQPFLEYFGDPELAGGISQYGGSLSTSQPRGVETFVPPDLSGFGMLAAQLLATQGGGGGTTVNVGSTSTPPPSGFYGGWEQASKYSKPLNYLSPRDKILGAG